MKVRKRPVVVDAVQFTGMNFEECKAFLEGNFDNKLNYPNVKTLEGTHEVNVGDFIIKGVEGEFYNCREDIFWKTYERVDG